jgi:flagellar protein FliO/FliZ
MTILGIGMSSKDSLLQLFGLTLLFIIILIVTYYTTKFIGGVKLNQMKKGNIKVLETFRITQNKYLQLVQIGTKYIVIAIGKNEIHCITELQESDLILQDQSVKKDINFLDILSKIAKKQEDKKKNDDQEIDHE